MKASEFVLVCLSFTGLATAQGFVGICPIVTANGAPVGLCDDGAGGLLFTDVGINAGYGVVDPASCGIAFQRNLTAHSGNPVGIARSSTNLFITDSTGPDVDVYDLTGAYVSSFQIGLQTYFPEGIAWSGATNHLYVIDGTPGNKCIEYTTAGVLVAEFALRGTSIDGIAWDPGDDTFWVYDSGTDTITHYSNSFAVLSTAPGVVAVGLSYGEGVALVGSDLYIMASGNDAIAHFDLHRVVAVTKRFGTGCPIPADWYELFVDIGGFDLAGIDLVLTPTGGGYAVTQCTTGCFDPTFSNNLAAGDDSLFAGTPLGFTIDVPGVGPVSSVDIDSNGRLGWGLANSSFSETVTEFLAQHVLAVCWDDFDPGAGGGVYADATPGRFTITWHRIPQFRNTDANTFQAQILANGTIILSYQVVTDDGLVGFSSGINSPDPGSIDISGSLPFSTGGGIPLVLTATTRPILGSTLRLGTTNLPSTTLAAEAALAMQRMANPLDLESLLGSPPGCLLLVDLFFQPLVSLPIQVGTGLAILPIPNTPSLSGVEFVGQSIAIDLAAPFRLPLYLSNGLQITLGTL